jgi:predicted amidohydrolase YtcJ
MMTAAARSLSLGLLLLALGPTAAARAQAPDAIYHNAKVVTVDEDFSVAEAVAVRDGRITAVGTSAEVRRLAGPETRLVDLGGRTLLPGFYDNHIHLSGPLQPWRSGSMIQSVPEWLRDLEDVPSVQAALRERARHTPPGEWIIGELNREDWPNQKVPTRWELDEAVPDHPVALHRGPHTLLLNSRAMEIAGITRDTPDPPGGWIIRDERGEPSGRVLEAAERLVRPHLPEEGDGMGALERWRTQLRQLRDLGVTSVNVAGVRPDRLRLVQELYERWGEELPRMTVQIRLSPGYDSYDDPEVGAREAIAELEALGFRTGFGDDRLRIGAVKMSIDGGLSAPVMWTTEPYPGRGDFSGVQRIPAETFYTVAKRAHDLGWQLGIHTIGDAAAVMVVDEMVKILRESPREDHRHYLHHVAVKPPEATLRTMGELGIMVATHPSWTTGLGGFVAEALSPERQRTQNPSRSLLDHGIRISYGSDAAPYGPVFGLWNAVTRRGWDGKVYGPEEAVTIEEAIRFHTTGTAFQTFDEARKGSIEPGKLADFVVLGGDILRADPERIREIPVERVVIGGREFPGGRAGGGR